jgi:hypothetical protein
VIVSFTHTAIRQLDIAEGSFGGSSSVSASGVVAVEEVVPAQSATGLDSTLRINAPRWDGSRLKSLWIYSTEDVTISTTPSDAGSTSNSVISGTSVASFELVGLLPAASGGLRFWHPMSATVVFADCFNYEDTLDNAVPLIGSEGWTIITGTWTAGGDNASCTPVDGLNVALQDIGITAGSLQATVTIPDGYFKGGVCFLAAEDGSTYVYVRLNYTADGTTVDVVSVVDGEATHIDGGYDGPDQFGGANSKVQIQVVFYPDGDDTTKLSVLAGVNCDTHTRYNCSPGPFTYTQTPTFAGLVIEHDDDAYPEAMGLYDFIASDSTVSANVSKNHLVVLPAGESSTRLTAKIPFAIPPGTVPVGVKCEVNCHGSDGNQRISSAKVMKNSADTGTGLSGTPATIANGSDSYAVTGGASNLGGATLLRSDVNRQIPQQWDSTSTPTGSFGVSFVVNNTDDTVQTVFVSNVRITVYYAAYTPTSVTLSGGIPYRWMEGDYYDCLFTEDVENGFTVVSDNSSDASITIRALVDSGSP